jgi:hypothetical protein
MKGKILYRTLVSTYLASFTATLEVYPVVSVVPNTLQSQIIRIT